MHCALEIHEILSDICVQCESTSDLPALARTCRTFKEPALDALWRWLSSLSPLVRCLPEACELQPAGRRNPAAYSFKRHLSRTEWDVLRTYTRRICSINVGTRVAVKTVTVLSDPPTAEPLFPNLRYLRFGHMSRKDAHFLRIPFPSLSVLSVDFMPNVLEDPLELFPESTPNLRRLELCACKRPGYAFNNCVSKCICKWRHLQSVSCTEILLDADAIIYLLHLPAINKLSLELSTNLPLSSPISLPDMHDMSLCSRSLEPISQHISCVRLPAITNFTFIIDNRFSRGELLSFFRNIQISGAGDFIESFEMKQTVPDPDHEVPLLGLEDLLPCAKFTRLRHIDISIEWEVNMNDDDLVTLASAWPRLELLYINEDTGWKTQGGITPNGLIRLMQACPSLAHVALAIDTRDHAHFPPPPKTFGLTLLSLCVVDSVIEEEAVPAVTDFFADIMFDDSGGLYARIGLGRPLPPNWEVYDRRWRTVRRGAYKRWRESVFESKEPHLGSKNE